MVSVSAHRGRTEVLANISMLCPSFMVRQNSRSYHIMMQINVRAAYHYIATGETLDGTYFIDDLQKYDGCNS